MHNVAVITRPLPDAEDTAKKLNDLGIESFIEPLLEIKYISDSNISSKTSGMQGLLITSGNSIRALSGSGFDKNFPIITVGQATAELALESGFTDVRTGGEDVSGLEKFITDNYSPENGGLIYASGDVVSSDLPSLRKNRFEIEHVVVYKAIAVEGFSEEFIKRLKAGGFNIVLLYSVRSAEILIKLLKKNNLLDYTKNLHVFCLSKNIANILDNSCFSSINYPSEPTNETLLELIGNFKFTGE